MDHPVGGSSECEGVVGGQQKEEVSGTEVVGGGSEGEGGVGEQEMEEVPGVGFDADLF